LTGKKNRNAYGKEGENEMKPIKFPQQNITYTKPEGMTDEECSSLPAFQYEGQIISCWEMSFKERIKVLFTGVIWFGVLAHRQPPIWLDVNTPFVKEKRK
jgi:hypothetical protein